MLLEGAMMIRYLTATLFNDYAGRLVAASSLKYFTSDIFRSTCLSFHWRLRKYFWSPADVMYACKITFVPPHKVSGRVLLTLLVA